MSSIELSWDEPPEVIAVIGEPKQVEVIGLPGEAGPPGPEGPPGPSGGGDSFVYSHIQTVPSDIWVIEHNLDVFLNVTTVDSAGTVIHGEVVYDDSNKITITFALAVIGKAYVS